MFMPKQNIALIGYRGTGKTTVAKKLAKKLDFTVFSIDQEIEKQIGCTIAEYVKQNSWPAFREIETTILKSTQKLTRTVLDCGGGIIENSENRLFLKKHCQVFWLKAEEPTIKSRLAHSKNRPSLTGTKSFLAEIEEVLKKRTPLYEATAHYAVLTDGLTMKQIANDILRNIYELKIAAVIVEPTIKDAIYEIQKVQKRAPLLELRLDYIQDLSQQGLKKLILACQKPVIVTNRLAQEGGQFKGSEQERLAYLKQALTYGVDFIDLAYASGPSVISEFQKIKGSTKLICSYHNFQEVPANLEGVFKQLQKTNADIIKIACMGQSYADNLKIFELIQKANSSKTPVIALLMGKYGRMSRVLSGFFGAWLTTYSSLSEQPSAPGQLSYDEVIESASKFFEF